MGAHRPLTRTRRLPAILVASVALCGALLALSPATALGAKRADLIVTTLSDPPAAAEPGTSFSATDTIQNKGKKKAGASQTAYFLSSDQQQGAGDIELARHGVDKLKTKKKATTQTELAVPASIVPGAFYLLACADIGTDVKEKGKGEGNNCRASAGAMTVFFPDGAPPPDGAAPPPPPPGGGTDYPPGYFPRPADPITVSPVLETSRAVSATITVSGGGTITATDSRGTEFTLTIPDGALLDDEEVTMTPVGSIGDFPFSGGLIGAVELRPHGLQLLRPATLAIEPPAGTPLNDATGFLAHQDGADFHLYPLGTAGGLRMGLTHFSTPGAGNATGADVQDVASHMPVRTKGQYEQAAAEIVKRLGEGADAAADELGAMLAAYYRDIVAPLADRALTDDTYAVAAIAELLSWARQLQLLGTADHPAVAAQHDDVFRLVERILRNAVNQGHQRCVAEHHLNEVVRLIAFERTAQLIGGLDLGDASGKAVKCARFELDLHVESTKVSPDHYTAETTVDVQDILLQLDPGTLRIEGEKGLTYTRFVLTSNDQHCSWSKNGEARGIEPARVFDLGLDYNMVEEVQPDGQVVIKIKPPKVAMAFDPGFGDEPLRWECPEGDSGTEDAGSYAATWYILHANERRAGFFMLEDWASTVGEGALIARKTYSRGPIGSEGGVQHTEATTLELYHTPQP